MRSTEFVDCMELPPGSLVEVETKHRIYRVECLGGSAIRISGHPKHCPTPVPGQLKGSANEGEPLEAGGVIGRGRRLEFFLENRGILLTTKVISVRVDATAATAESFTRRAA